MNYEQLQSDERLFIGHIFKLSFVLHCGVGAWQDEAPTKDEIYKPTERCKELSGADADKQRGQRVPKRSELRLGWLDSRADRYGFAGPS